MHNSSLQQSHTVNKEPYVIDKCVPVPLLLLHALRGVGVHCRFGKRDSLVLALQRRREGAECEDTHCVCIPIGDCPFV